MTGNVSLPEVVLHQDDVGMCHGANTAFVELSRFGTITSGSVMVPCPWFLEVAEVAAADALLGDRGLDLGVHLTLTAEKQHYKWGPLTRPTAAAGLTDANGYFFSDVSSVRRNAHPDAVEAEFRAQIERALAVGIDVTHLDAHMGAALAPEFCDAYIRAGVDFRLPMLLTADITAYAPNNHLVGVDQSTFAPFVERAAAAGVPVFDRVMETDWNRTDPPGPAYERLIGSCTDAMTFICLHPNAPGELEFIEPTSSYIRTDEYNVFRSTGYRGWLAGLSIAPIGMREVRERFRNAPSR
ncbi:MAG: ChbG/HpnK family deacetylase [Actinomycetota bacterium]|nr:ChbG/HpnK family deacetylase [Actinomycetota bacterium]